jgi:hypothetical protein
LVAECGAGRDDLVGALTAAGLLITTDGECSAALNRVTTKAPDVIIVDEALGEPVWTLLADLSRFNVGRVLVLRSNDAEHAARAIRLGVHDIVIATGEADPAAVLRAAAFARAAGERLRAKARSRSRLRRRVQALRDGHTQLLRQVADLASGVAGTCRTLGEQMQRVAMGAEFNAMIRQELELEGLLRTTLEFVLRKAGSTNAAIFLPSSSGDYTLGAYINFDLPKDTAETMLGQLANCLAPACEPCRELRVFPAAADLGADGLDSDHWLGESTLAVRACWSDRECIATLAIFRDHRHPFTEDAKPALDVIADLFSAQLARVIKTHYRGKPKEEWGAGDAAAA